MYADKRASGKGRKARTRRGNHYGTLRLRGRMYWARWKYKGEFFERSTGISVFEKGAERKAILKLEQLTSPYRLADERDVSAVLSMRAKTLEEALMDSVVRGDDILLKEVFDAFKNSPRRREVKESRMSWYLRVLTSLAETLGPETRMRSVTATMAEDYANALAARVSNLTHNNYITAISYVWDVLSTRSKMQVNPWKGIRMKSDDSVSRAPLSDEEIAKLKKTAGTRHNGELRLLITVGENTGLRLGDCALLKWENVHFADGFIRSKNIKTGAEVSIPLLKALRKEFESFPVEQRKPGSYIMPKMAHKYLTTKGGLSAMMTGIFSRANIKEAVKVNDHSNKRPSKTFHSLRTTFVTKCAEADISLEIVKTIVGHSTTGMTDHYTKIREKAVKEAFLKAGVD